MLHRARLCHSISSVNPIPFVRPRVTFPYRGHIGWNTGTSKIILRLNSLRYLLGFTPNIQGHWFWYESKARVQLPICPS